MYIFRKFERFKNSRRARKTVFSGFFCILIIFSLLIAPKLSFSQEETSTPKRAEELRAELNAQLEELNKQIEVYRENVRQIQGQAEGLKKEIGLFDNQIKQFELEIKRIKLMIEGLESDISDVQLNIKELEQRAENEKVILGELIREIYKYDDTSIFEIILIKGKLSDFFSELQSLESLGIGIQKSLEKIRSLKEQLAFKKQDLEEEKNEMIALKAVQEVQQQSLNRKKQERKKLLEETRGREYLYQQLVKNKQADINTIKSQLYILQGMGGSLSFENALNFAEFASSVTGVRPAFLLALLSKESGWGGNVGTGTWRKDMNPNQHNAYLGICEKLQLNPDLMPVSRKAWYGWGGAMGPAQFLPRTWLGYESRIAAITGHNPPSPWDIEDAFVAAALYLANAGATNHSYNTEWRAAMIYLAGANWQKPYLRFYGDQIMDLAAKIQEQVNIIKGKS